MQEIKCPNCGEVFQVDESGYAQIAQQVRDKEFEKELSRRQQDMDAKRTSDLTIARMEQEKIYQEKLTSKDQQIAEKDRQIEQLQAQLTNSETEKRLAVTETRLSAKKSSSLPRKIRRSRVSEHSSIRRILKRNSLFQKQCRPRTRRSQTVIPKSSDLKVSLSVGQQKANCGRRPSKSSTRAR